MSESSFSQAVARAGVGWGTRLVVAHRGASASEAENTIAAFERAIAAGADAVEFDVRLTADGHPVVLHDPDVSRTTDGVGLVRDLTLADVKGLRIRTSDGDAAEVPTLIEALDCCLGRIAVDIELKNIPGEPDFEAEHQGVAETVVQTVQASAATGEILVSSFNPFALACVTELAPDVAIGLLTPPGMEASAALDLARERGFGWILPFVRQVSQAGPELVAEAHRAEVAVGTWITDDPAEVVALFHTGVDAIATNDPVGVVPVVRGAFG